MKNIVTLIVIITLLTGCESGENNINEELTGNKAVYTLFQGSDYNISGNVIIEETVSKSAIISLELSGTQEGLSHPVHLHYDNIAGDGDIAAVLTPVDGKNGKSTTELTLFENSRQITYADLVEMEASIKVHLSNLGVEKNIILAGGNIGSAYTKADPYGRVDISVCKSN